MPSATVLNTVGLIRIRCVALFAPDILGSSAVNPFLVEMLRS
jgi:hypothetical protein